MPTKRKAPSKRKPAVKREAMPEAKQGEADKLEVEPAEENESTKLEVDPAEETKLEIPSDDEGEADDNDKAYEGEEADDEEETDEEVKNEPDSDYKDVKPDTDRATQPDESDYEDKPRKRARTHKSTARSTNGKKWSGPELETLLLTAVGKVPQARFDGAIPGRTPKQCKVTWYNTIQPALLKFLRERGGE